MGSKNLNERCIHSDLRVTSVKIRAISHLIESQGIVDLPLDMGEVYWGLGLILAELAEQVMNASRELEEREIKKAKKGVKQ